MAVFVSASDESSGKNQRDNFLLAGWVAPEQDWSQFFAPAWQERVLDGPPAIPYLHMTEIRSPAWRAKYGLSDLQASDRIDEAFKLIDTMQTLFPVGVPVDAGHMRDTFAETKVVASTGGNRPFEPDYICFLAYAWVSLNYLKLFHPGADKLDFIVERNGPITRYIHEFHSHLAEALTALGSPELADLVGELIPGDKTRAPLQAADVLCWYSARSRAGTLDDTDKCRYAKIAHRNPSGWVPLTNEHISQIEAALKA
jgi:hypothetical protein